jgi:hypothetical protein
VHDVRWQRGRQHAEKIRAVDVIVGRAEGALAQLAERLAQEHAAVLPAPVLDRLRP